MSQPIISARNVSKTYRLGAIGATSLRDEVARLWNRARRVGTASRSGVDFCDNCSGVFRSMLFKA